WPYWSASLIIDSFSEAEKLLLVFDIIPKFSDLIALAILSSHLGGQYTGKRGLRILFKITLVFQKKEYNLIFMRKGLFSCLLLLCTAANTVSAQRLMHGLGTTISVLFGKISGGGESADFAMSQASFCWFPRYNFIDNGSSSFSIGAPLAAGVGIASNADLFDKGAVFAFELPVAVDYNFGCNASFDSDKNVGGYAGLGYSYYKVSIAGSQYSDFKGVSHGPVVRAGMRFANENWSGRGITVGMFYKMGIEKNKLSTVGFHILYDL
ncbi:MAG: hypothetical protein HYZ15_12370, partial [Sphingobacteriales bacterium]|nr:hypothetical protein [Sphingobacteriales bacterium]